VIKIATEVENHLLSLDHPSSPNPNSLKPIPNNLTIAIMGCAVNGPGEAKQADYGIAGGTNEGVIFAKGKIIKKSPGENLISELLSLINKGQ
jgi:(E)-4-hydroxy-3-methylbut-2-enyl-diphosphate synthase